MQIITRGRSPVALALVFVSALFISGAKWAEKPINSLESIAGEWSGSGTTARGGNFVIEFLFKEDGSYAYEWSDFHGRGDKGERPANTMNLNDGKLGWTTEKGRSYAVTLEETEKGERKLIGRRDDGLKWRIKPKQ